MRTGTKIVDGVEKSYVELYVDSDDTVLFTNTASGESCIACQGQGAIVYDDGTVEGPFPIPPEEQDAWKSGFDMVYDDSGGKKGMRDVDEEGSGTGDDTGDDVNDTTSDQNNTQDDANQDQTGEQDIYGLAKVDIITDSDGDGLSDNDEAEGDTPFGYETDPLKADTDDDEVDDSEDRFPRDSYEQEDTDNDVPVYWSLLDRGSEDTNLFMPDELYPGDNEDAFPKDTELPWYEDNEFPFSEFREIGVFSDEFDKPFYGWRLYTDEDEIPDVIVRGYGSRYELNQALLKNLTDIETPRQEIQDLMGDINSMIGDIQDRNYEAIKEKIFDAQAEKVMVDRWGNRVRVEEYIFRPTDKQVQILALNLRTDGPNAGISSFDFKTTFDRSISGSLQDLPWDDYMSVYERGELDGVIVVLGANGNGGNGGYDYDDTLLIGYESDPKAANWLLPREFSVEAKNPYGDSLKVIESYSADIDYGTIDKEPLWYQTQSEGGDRTFLNNTEYFYPDGEPGWWTEDWAEDWRDENRDIFFDYYVDSDEQPVAWLAGVFYLINDDGSPVTDVNEDYLDDDGALDILSVRNCLNPEYNMEMVFFSSEFGNTSEILEDMIKNENLPEGVDEEFLYHTFRNIDVITIPEIAEPYYTPEPE